MNVNLKNNKTFLLIIIGIYILTFIIISKNINTPYLWYDEAGQFFISKGLNHDSNPMENEKGLIDVVKNNAFYNLDPGGFSILLHFWTQISNSHIWLRFLPFIFFIGILLSVIYLSYLWLKNLNIALLLGFIPILIPTFIRMGFELRAYSMEILGAMLGVVALEKLKNKISVKYLFLWGCVFSFFITSRYSEIVIIFVVSIYVLYFILILKLSLIQKITAVLSYSLPILISLTYIYFFALVYQNKNIEQVAYLPYISNDINILFTPNDNLIYISFIAFLIILYFMKNRFTIIKKYQLLISLTISINVFFVFLSFIGKHPWCPFSNRCISFFSITLLCIIAFLGELIISNLKKYEFLKYFIIPSLIFILFLKRNTLTIRQVQNNTYYNFVKTDIKNFNRIYVDWWESPCIRYLFEYGKLKTTEKSDYPEKFTFGKYIRHGFYKGKISRDDFIKLHPKMNNLLEYDLLITPELIDYGFSDKWKLIGGTTNFFIKR